MKVADWTAALRSGKYEQGQGVLCDGSAFCCLGVLAEEAGFKKVAHEEEAYMEYLFPTDEDAGDSFQRSETRIPRNLQRTILEDLNLRIKMPPTEDFDRDELHGRLMSMNDSGSTFAEIADYIDEVANANQ